MSKTQINQIKPSEHVFIAGRTGTGKSVLAEIYLAGYDHVIKLDTKDEVSERRRDGKPLWRGLVEDADFEVCYSMAEVMSARCDKVIYVPPVESQNIDGYNEFFQWCYDRQNIIVWVDELMSICDNPQRYPLALKSIYTRGRSRNVVCWSLTQRPMDIPTIVMANSTHFFIFALALDQDRKKVANSTGCPQLLDKPSGHEFWYFKDGEDTAVLAKLKI